MSQYTVPSIRRGDRRRHPLQQTGRRCGCRNTNYGVIIDLVRRGQIRNAIAQTGTRLIGICGPTHGHIDHAGGVRAERAPGRRNQGRHQADVFLLEALDERPRVRVRRACTVTPDRGRTRATVTWAGEFEVFHCPRIRRGAGARQSATSSSDVGDVLFEG